MRLIPQPLKTLLCADFHAQFPERSPSFARMATLAVLEPAWAATLCLRLQAYLHGRERHVLARLVRAHNIRSHGMDVQRGVQVGPGLVLRHPTGIVLGEQVRVGARCWLGPGVFLGRSRPEHAVQRPTRVCDDVVLGAHCMVVGEVVVGDGVVVGAGAVVTGDVPAGARVAGVPARQLTRQGTSA